FFVLLQLLVESLETLPLDCEVSRGPTRPFDPVPLIIELILDLVEALEVEKDIDDLPPIIEHLFDEPFKVFLGNYTTCDNLVVSYPSSQPFDLGRHVFDGAGEGLCRPVGSHLDERRSVGSGLVDLPDHAVPILA